jgi:phospholipid/cholesterol/gamma-HCH transport system substrate-binding protein
VNDQRDDLVTLLQSLDRLGDVATGVIRQSKADTVADLKLLVPTLTNLSASVDDFAYDFKALLSYPFVDSAAGGVPAKAFGRCSNTDRDKNTGYCTGDFANLSVRLEVGADNLEGVLSLLGLDLAGLGDGGAPAAPSDLPEIPVIPGVAELQEALKGLNLPGLGALTSPSAPSTNSTNAPATPAPDAGSNSGTGSGGGGLLCGLFGSCRVAPAPDLGSADLASVLLQPAVTP